MDTNDAIETAQAFPDAVIVPVHTEGWAHFKQSGDDLQKTFTALGFGSRLRLLQPGVATPVAPLHHSRANTRLANQPISSAMTAVARP